MQTGKRKYNIISTLAMTYRPQGTGMPGPSTAKFPVAVPAYAVSREITSEMSYFGRALNIQIGESSLMLHDRLFILLVSVYYTFFLSFSN